MKTLTIKAFGIARDILGGREVTIQLEDEGTVAELRAVLEQAHPQLKTLRSLFIAVNSAYAEDGARLLEEDEIALIPPVSGG